MRNRATKWLAVLLALLICLPIAWTNAAQAKSAADFDDLSDLDAATKAKFDAMIEAGIFNGVSENSFGLHDKFNRAQFAKVAALIFGLEVDTGLKHSSFNDVLSEGSNGYALPYIEALKAAGITDGMGDGKFDPSGSVTKEQLAAFLVKGLGMKEEAEKTPGIEDPTVSEWAKNYVQLALDMKLLTQGVDEYFGGKEQITRENIVLIAYEAKPVIEQSVEEKKAKEQADKEAEEQKEEEKETPTPTSTPTPTPVSDTSAPSFASGYPMAGAAQAAGSRQAQLLVQANEGGTAYYVVVAKDAAAPSTAQVIAGQDSTGAAALAAGNSAFSANSALNLTTTALPADDTAYDAYVVVRDSSGNATAPVKVAIQTPMPQQITVAMPTATPGSTTVTESTYVSLSTTTEGASIYYTTDGSTPTESSTLYAAQIHITETTTIKAIGVLAGAVNSEVMTATYTMTAPEFAISEVEYLGTSTLCITFNDTITDSVTYGNALNYVLSSDGQPDTGAMDAEVYANTVVLTIDDTWYSPLPEGTEINLKIYNGSALIMEFNFPQHLVPLEG